VESRITISVPPEKILEIYADVRNWKTWDSDTKESSIDGPFQTGSKGKITPPKGITVPMSGAYCRQSIAHRAADHFGIAQATGGAWQDCCLKWPAYRHAPAHVMPMTLADARPPEAGISLCSISC